MNLPASIVHQKVQTSFTPDNYTHQTVASEGLGSMYFLVRESERFPNIKRRLTLVRITRKLCKENFTYHIGIPKRKSPGGEN